MTLLADIPMVRWTGAPNRDGLAESLNVCAPCLKKMLTDTPLMSDESVERIDDDAPCDMCGDGYCQGDGRGYGRGDE